MPHGGFLPTRVVPSQPPVLERMGFLLRPVQPDETGNRLEMRWYLWKTNLL